MRTLGVWLFGFVIAFVPLSILIPTDFPRKSGDEYLDIVKAVSAALIGVLCVMRWRAERRAELKKSEDEEEA